MLVLTRPVGGVLHIGDAITVTVVELKGRQVRLGIGAPSAVPIYRSELAQRIGSERRSSSHESDRVPHRPETASGGRRGC